MKGIALVILLQPLLMLVFCRRCDYGPRYDDIETNFCDTDLRPKNVENTGCTVNCYYERDSSWAYGNFAPACGAEGVRFVDVDWHNAKDMIVDRHNYYRNLIAGGKVEGFPKAYRMSYMQWDKELSLLAKLHAKKCDIRQDACRNTPRFRIAGQNLGWTTWDPQNYIANINKTVDRWFEEYKNSNVEQILDYYPKNCTENFTQMVNAQSNRIGCATLVVSDGRLLMVCNYGRRNLVGYRVYKPGFYAATECKNGTDTKYESLCAITEPVNPNELDMDRDIREVVSGIINNATNVKTQ